MFAFKLRSENISILLLLLVFISTLACNQKEKKEQKTAKTVSGEQQPEQPYMKDWFLATGDWNGDPQIYVREFGSGKDTILMLHGGWGAEHSGMIAMVDGLENEYKFFIHEQRGSLRSPFPDSLITYDNHIEDVERLRKELKLQKLRLVGHSMGAVLASAYAKKYPERIEKLVLLSPAYLKQPFPEEDLELLDTSGKNYQSFSQRPAVNAELERLDLIREEPALSSKEETIKNRVGFANMMLYDIERWDKLANGKALYKAKVFGLTQQTYPKEGWDFFEDFSRHSYPITIIIGDHDRFDMGNHITRKWSSEVPRIEFISMENAGHLLWIDQPNGIIELLGEQM